MNTNDQKDYFLKIMKQSKACYLSTINENGLPEIRAMLNLRNNKIFPELKKIFENHNNDFLVYLTTNTSSQKMNQIMKNKKIALYYCDPDNFQGVMINGSVEIENDISIKKSIWQSNWKMYYPGGYTDPDYTILCLKPDIVKAYGNFNIYTIFPKENK